VFLKEKIITDDKKQYPFLFNIFLPEKWGDLAHLEICSVGLWRKKIFHPINQVGALVE
jgi:hypothetical protein